MDWSTACVDWERRIVAGESLITFPPLFPAEAESALEVFRDLRLVDVAGQPTFGEAARPWIMDFAAAVFGAYDHKAGRRLIREFLLLIAKKNGKSTLAAGIMLTALVRNWRQSAEFLILAPTIEVANNSFIPVRDMIRADETLSALLHISEFHRTITHMTTGATLRVIAADKDTVSGKKATGVLVDELWLFGKKPNAENMLVEATGGLASRPEGFIIYLTTHSDEQPVGVWKKKLQYFRGVRDGITQDKRCLPVLYEFPKAMLDAEEFLDQDRWHITNPNLGASVDPEFISSQLAQADSGGEESRQSILAKFLNVEIGLRLGGGWAGAEFWEAQAAPLTLADLLRRCEVVCVGIDGGGLDDLLGLAVVGREKGTRDWLCWNRAWAHPIALQRRKEIAARLRDFAASGDLRMAETTGEDIAEAADIVAEVAASGLLWKVGLDAAGIGAIVDALAERGIEGEQLAAVTQGYKLNGAIKTTERKLAEGSLWHAGQALMAWCVGNAKVEPKGNAILITKQASGSAKIDPLMATFSAVELMSRNPSVGGSYLETSDLAVL